VRKHRALTKVLVFQQCRPLLKLRLHLLLALTLVWRVNLLNLLLRQLVVQTHLQTPWRARQKRATTNPKLGKQRS
jgi:hypothetical protein